MPEMLKFGIKHLTASLLFIIIISENDVNAGKQQSECNCSKREFTCGQGSMTRCSCIPMKWKCDGDYDCGDYSDENDCDPPPCPSDWFRCSNGHCIKLDWKCDGDNDCFDDSDEENCPKECDPVNDMTCDSGDCIVSRWWCDDQEDCDDGSDEKSCEPENCTEFHFACKSRECIPLHHKCDGDFDCRDGSDEESCYDYRTEVIVGSNVTCKGDEFFCGRYPHVSEFSGEPCILREYVCDGDRDCDSGRDEENCALQCTSEQFACNNGQCIRLQNHCDTVDDCGDGSDEIDCQHESCLDGEFKCEDKLCISRSWRCDGDPDCQDGSDEKDCESLRNSCDENNFHCHTGNRCILSSYRCDGDDDCEDSSDELYCECKVNQFFCKSGECIPLGKLCDKVPDCEDGSDEQPINPCNSSFVLGLNTTSCAFKNGGCEFKCKPTITGQRQCICRKGFRLANDMRSCIDIDECVVAGSCSQTCNNTIGSFICSCLAGYQLLADGRTCKASGPALSLLFTNRIDIRRMSPDRTGLKPILRNLENAIGLDYHIDRELVFWSDVTLDKIMRSNINGSDVKEVISSGLESPGGVAVDWVHDLLYWTDSRTSRIEVSQLSGQNRKVLIWQGLQKPRALALHPLKGLMFWTDWGKSPYLGSAAMDGSMRQSLASHNIFWPNGLTIDYTNNRLYWSDAKYHIIETANLDGTNRKPVISRGLPHPFGVTIFEDKVYWTDWHTKSVNSANKFTGNGVKTIKKQLHFPMDIRTYHPLRQPKGVNKCQNANCSHLCLPQPQGFTCACPTGFRTVNGTQCAESIDTFLVFTRKNDIRQISFDANERADIVLPLEGLKNVVALDWDGGPPGYIYWSDIGLDTINRCELDGSNQKEVISSSLDSPAGIAVDWITNKIYWTDSGINRIEVAMLDGSMRSVLVWTGLDKPRAIIVNPSTGHMFWTDWGMPAKIERAGMDGSNRVTIVSTGLKWPNGITIDYVDQRLYWVDAGTQRIETSNINGQKRKTFISPVEHPFGITLDETKIYWTDWTNKSIQSADKATGKNRTFVRRDLLHLMDIRYYNNSRPIIPNPCSIINGGCSHLCLLSPISDETNRLHGAPSYSCACPTGLVLGSDKRTCNTNMNKFLVVARRLDIRVISLDVNYSADVRLNIDAYMTNVVDVAVDPIEGYLYWSDIGSMQINRVLLSENPGNESVVIDSGLDTVDAIAIDVDGRLLYWTDDGANTISVSTLDGGIRRVLIGNNLDSPRAIALHYSSGYIYWTDWGNSPNAKIERAGLDGSNRSVIISTGLSWPNGLTIDPVEGWLIWGDAQTEKIERSDLLGGNRATLLHPVPHAYSLTTLNGFLYWTDWQTRNIAFMSLRDTTMTSVVRENMPSMMGIKAVSMNVTAHNICGKNNGGCSHLCLRSPTAKIGYICACPTGVRLQNDGKTCSKIPSEYVLFTKRKSIQRLSLEADENIPVELPVKNLENVIALDYHFDQQLLFYTDVYMDVIQRANLDGTNAQTIVSDNLKTMDGLAVDWIADNLYWTDAGLNTISVCSLNGKNRKVIIKNNLDEPRAISLHPTIGTIFWSDWGEKAKIEKAFMDGSNRKVLVRKNLKWPNGITIDFSNSRLYWVDGYSLYNHIESCDLNGRKRKVVVSPVPHGFSITYLSNTLYWTDWQTKSIHSAVLPLGKSRKQIVLKGVEELIALKAVSASRQTGTNNCDSSRGYGGCKYLCLMKGPTKYICDRPDDVDDEELFVAVDKSTFDRFTSKVINVTDATVGKKFEVTTSAVASVERIHKKDPSISILVGVGLGTAFFVFVLFACIGFIVWRRAKQINSQSQDQSSDNVIFHNPTYKANSTNQTPTISIRTLDAEDEKKSEVEIPLLGASPEESTNQLSLRNEDEKDVNFKSINKATDFTKDASHYNKETTSSSLSEHEIETEVEETEPLLLSNCSNSPNLDAGINHRTVTTQSTSNIPINICANDLGPEHDLSLSDDSSPMTTPKMSVATTCSTLCESDFHETEDSLPDENLKVNITPVEIDLNKT